MSDGDFEYKYYDNSELVVKTTKTKGQIEFEKFKNIDFPEVFDTIYNNIQDSLNLTYGERILRENIILNSVNTTVYLEDGSSSLLDWMFLSLEVSVEMIEFSFDLKCDSIIKQRGLTIMYILNKDRYRDKFVYKNLYSDQSELIYDWDKFEGISDDEEIAKEKEVKKQLFLKEVRFALRLYGDIVKEEYYEE